MSENRGTATRLNFNIHGARIRVINNDSNARHPIETLTISSFKLKLKKADIEAIPRAIKEVTNISSYYLMLIFRMENFVLEKITFLAFLNIIIFQGIIRHQQKYPTSIKLHNS